MRLRSSVLVLSLLWACGPGGSQYATPPDSGRPDAGADVADLVGSIDGGTLVVAGWDLIPFGYLSPGQDPIPRDAGVNRYFTVEMTSYLNGCQERMDLHSARDAEIFELRLGQTQHDAGTERYMMPEESGDYVVYDNSSGFELDAGPEKAAFVRYYKTGPSCEPVERAAWHAVSGVVHLTAPTISGNGVTWLDRAKASFAVKLGTGDNLTGSFELSRCTPITTRETSCF